VKADPTDIENALLNLVINARDAMPEGGQIFIETRNVVDEDGNGEVEKPGRYVCLAVTDTGCGMTPDVSVHAFEVFFTTKSPSLGRGLGLATVDDFVQRLDGVVKLRSELDQGTTIGIYLPALRN
jgi:signal transduction histidine kinase